TRRSHQERLALAGLTGLYALIEFRRLTAWNRQRFPLIALKVLREQDDLPAMVSIVSKLARDGLHDRMPLASDGGDAAQIVVRERGKSGENDGPRIIPALHALGAASGRVPELRITIAIGFFAVGFRKAAPSRAHVAGQMLDD